MRFGDIATGLFYLVAAYLVLTNWQAFNTIAQTGSAFTQHYTQILQGRQPSQFIST